MGSLFNPVITAIGNPIAAATQGSVLFAGVGGVLQQDNANFNWKGAGVTVAGQGLTLNTGIAASAVSALKITQTWNFNAAPLDAIDIVFTDTSSHANTNALRIRGGAAGTTGLLTLSKGGFLTSTRFTDAAGAYLGGGNLLLSTGGWIYAGRGYLRWPSDGVWLINNAAENGAIVNLQFHTDTNISRLSGGLLGISTGAAGSFAGSLKLTDLFTNNATYLIRTNTSLTDSQALQAATLGNAPVAGNPTKWVAIDDNGTPRYIPTW